MQIDDLRAFRNNEPFRPFWLRLNDGRELFVERPSYIGFSPNGKLVLVVTSSKTEWFAPDQVAGASYRPNAKSA